MSKSIEMNDNIETLKTLVLNNGGDLWEVLIYDGNRHFVVSIESFTDCMDDTTYYTESRYDLSFKDIKSWYLIVK